MHHAARTRSPLAPGRPAALLAALALLAGCDGITGSGPVPAEVRLSPREATLFEEQVDTLAAEVLDAAGKPVPRARVEWTSSDAAVVEVSAEGAVTGRAPGAAWVVATLPRSAGASLRDSARVTVRSTPAAIRYGGGFWTSAPVGAPLRPVALRVEDRRGAPVPGVEVRFSVVQGGGTVAPASAVTDSAGLVTVSVTLGPLPGEMVWEARADGMEAPARFTVEAVMPPKPRLDPAPVVLPEFCSRTVVARVPGPDGSDLLGTSAEFTVLDTGVVTLTTLMIPGSYRGVTRLVTPKRVGTTRIVATWKGDGNFPGWEGVSDTAEVRVLPQTPVRIELPLGARVGIGGTYRPLVRVHGDGAGLDVPGCSNLVPDADYTLASLDPEVAGVSGKEIVGRSPGTARIVAALGALRDTLAFQVLDVRLLPADTTVSVGDTVRYRVVDEQGRTVTGTGFSLYPSESPVYAVVAAEGAAVAAAPGTATVRAWYSAPLGATLRVRAPGDTGAADRPRRSRR